MRLRTFSSSSRRRSLTSLFIAGVMSALLTACGGYSGGDNSAEINEAPLPDPNTSLLQGYVSQTRVTGATVWIDRADAGGAYNNVLDFGETSGTTSSNGLFSLTMSNLDESNNYRLITVGGSAQSVSTSAESVGVMLAPRGARNITPLTTVVALNNELASKIEQDLLSNSSQTYSTSYDVDIAKSGGTYGEHLQLAKGIEVFMYVLGRTNPDLPLISSTQGHVAALQILADNLNELDQDSLFSAANIATKIGEAATEVLASNSIDSLVALSATDQAAIAADIASAATDVMGAISTGTGSLQTEASVISACTSAFASSDLVSNSTLSTTATALPPYASALTIADKTGSVVYSSTAEDFTVDNDTDFGDITVTFTESLSNGESLNIDNITFAIGGGASFRIDNVTFAQDSQGNVSIGFNNPGCDITSSGGSVTLDFDNVTSACQVPAGIGTLDGAAGNYSFTVSSLDAQSDNLSRSFELNITD